MQTVLRGLEALFPKQAIFSRRWTLQQQWALFLALGVAFYALGVFIPANGFIAFDWVQVFSTGRSLPFYPPWAALVTRPLTWPLLVSLSLAGVGLAALKRAVHPVSAVAVFLSLPVFWTVFLGQLEGLVVVGLLGLPWLVPLALLKPQISAFALGARKSYLVAGLVWVGLSLLLWGPWPLRMLAVNSYYAEGRYVQDIALGWAGVVVAAPLFWLSRGDPDMLMLSGAFMTPHLIPYNLLPLAPAIARLKPAPALAACLLSWLPFAANWVGRAGWWLGWGFVIWLWAGLAVRRYAGRGLLARGWLAGLARIVKESTP